MNSCKIKHMTYVELNSNQIECHNAITGKKWIVDRMTNPLAWADCVGKFVAVKDRARRSR